MMMSNRKLEYMRNHRLFRSIDLNEQIVQCWIFVNLRNGRRIPKRYRKRYRVYMDIHCQNYLKFSYAACLYSEIFPNTKKPRLRTLNKYHSKHLKYIGLKIIKLGW